MVEALEHHVRYEMIWGHKVYNKSGRVEVNRAEYNTAFGVESPDSPTIPDAVIHIWGWWWHLNSRRPPGYDSIPPLTYSEIQHWSALTRTQVTPTEIGIIMRVDDAYLQAVRTERKEQRDRDKTS